MMSWLIVFVSLAIVPSQTSAAEKLITFTAPDAGDIVVKLENYNTQQEIINLCTEEKQVCSDQLAKDEQTIAQLNETIVNQKDAYEEKIKKDKPSIFRDVWIALSGIGIGALLVKLLPALVAL